VTNAAGETADFPKPRFTAFAGIVRRIVESQEDAATLRIADNLADQARLETLIETSKPAPRESGADRPALHYLLSTPFRYPPLRHGSRFGSRFEPGLFYGSLERQTCVQECAYYRLLFWHDMAEPPPRPIRCSHTLFSAAVSTQRCVDLRARPWDTMTAALRSPVSYRYTQALGAQLRRIETEALLFASARGPGSNGALYSPSAFAAGTPRSQSPWLSEVDGARASFRGDGVTLSFDLQQFCSPDGMLLRAA
jgi:hypothetical protein